jgi:hypothetical protein
MRLLKMAYNFVKIRANVVQTPKKKTSPHSVSTDFIHVIIVYLTTMVTICAAYFNVKCLYILLTYCIHVFSFMLRINSNYSLLLLVIKK